MNFVHTSKAPEAIGPYSQAVAINGMLYTSGQIALKPNGEFLNGSVSEQTEQVLQNLGNVLQAGGGSLNSVVKTTIFLADMSDFVTVNEIYSKYFGDHKPARSTVAVNRLPKDALVEIEAVAIIE